MKNFFYCVLLDEDKKLFDVVGPLSDDTEFMLSVVEAQKKGHNIHCDVVNCSEVKSKKDLEQDDVPKGYKYYEGLIREFGINW